MSTHSSAPAPVSASSTSAAPVSDRAAFAVLGSMLLLIAALTLLLIQTTWVDPAGASEAPPVASAGGSLGRP